MSSKNTQPIPGQWSIFQCLKPQQATVQSDSSQSFSGENVTDLPSSSPVPKQMSADQSVSERPSMGCHLGARFLDIGTIDIKTKLWMSDSLKMSALTSRFEPPTELGKAYKVTGQKSNT